MNRSLGRPLLTALVAAAILPSAAGACIWDSDTLAEERAGSPRLAEVVLGKAAHTPDAGKLRARIRQLEAEPREDDPAWWNDLAGAHIRLGETQRAVELLEPAVRRFPKDYGVHANLGTAYHLLGRYREAEREIARDLEINPQAHFGLERYHLALLQYLSRDQTYQSRHVYVDEWTYSFLVGAPTSPRLSGAEGKLKPGFDWRERYQEFRPGESAAEARERLLRAAEAEPSTGQAEYLRRWARAVPAVADPPVSYRYRWDLGHDPKLEEGVLYLASLNPRQPACFTMLGIVCLKRGDLHLAAAAFRRALDLGSPQAELLRERIAGIRTHQRAGAIQNAPQTIVKVALAALAVLLLVRLYRWSRLRLVRSRTTSRSA